MAARLTIAEPRDRGDSLIVAAMRLGVLVLVVVTGTAAGLATLGTWPQIGIGVRVLAGLGVALIITGLIVVPLYPRRWWLP